MPRRVTPGAAGQWGAVLPQWLGILGLIFCALVWLLTNRIEPLLLGAFGSLIGIGQGAEAVRALRQPPDPRRPEDST